MLICTWQRCQLRPNTKNTKKERKCRNQKQKELLTQQHFHQIPIFPWPLILRDYQNYPASEPWHTRGFFCCTLLACHEGRGRSPSVSGIGEKTDFLTFQLNCKNIQQIKQQCKQTINAEVELGQRPRTCGYSRLMAPYPSVARVSWGFRDTTDGECIGTGTQRNRRSDRIRVVEPQMTKWVRWNNPAKAYYRVPVSWRAQAT